MEHELVSVIMACYNERIDWLMQSVDSILNQTYRNIEFIIICDNPNNNKIIEIMTKKERDDKRIKFIINEKNLGLTQSLNKGLKLANGDYIARMDADDISFKNRLEIEIDEIKKKGLDFVIACAEFIDEQGKVFYTTKTQKVTSNNIKNMLKYTNVSVHPTWMFKKSILKKIVKYHDLDYAEDYDFICRSILDKVKIGVIDENLIQYRVRDNGITVSKKALQEISFQVINKNYRAALNSNRTYSAEEDFRNIILTEKEMYQEEHNSFKVYKSLVKQNKYITGISGMIKVVIKSKYKRNQIINHIKYKIIKVLL